MKKISLSEWASIAEVIGAIGVVVSLIYVGVQVRDNTEEIRATNRQALIGRAHTATLALASNPQPSGAVAKLANGEPLSGVELIQYEYFVRGLQYDVQEAFMLRTEGRLDEEYWQTRAALFGVTMSQETAQAVYRRDREFGLLLPDFVHWADQQLGLTGSP